MYASQRIARIMGPAFFVIGLGMLMNGGAYRTMAMQLLSGSPYIYFSGVLLMVTGLAILNAHNLWTRDWRSLISAVGLFMTCVGVFRILAPQFPVFLMGTMFSSIEFFVAAGIIFLSIGAFITFKGYTT